MALHVGSHLEELAHECPGADFVVDILLVVEQHLHQTFGVGQLLVVLVAQFAGAASLLANLTFPGLVEVILERLADVVVDTGGGIGGCQFLALGFH